jgi:large subunit ribosomal protein L25
VDVTALNIHDAIHVSQVRMPEKVTVVFDEDDDFAVVTVVPPTVEAPAPGAGEEAAAAPAEGEEAKAEGEEAKES